MISPDRYCFSCGAANPSAAASCFACGLSLKITEPLPQDDFNPPLLQQRYRILAQLGAGGSSAVYKAEDTLLNDRLVAIKAISLRGLQSQEIIDATEAFNREVLLLSGLKHPSIPHLHHSFSDQEGWYVVMDFIEGTTLEKHLDSIRGRQLPIGEVLEVALQLCSVLDYLHTSQPPIIFRDLKLANIMLKSDGRIALIDFGIARHFKPGQAKDTMPFGSPGYAAPEQYGKAQTTPRTDIYSLGVILHQLLTGKDPSLTPFCFAPLPFEDQPALTELETLIKQMVQLDIDKRPASISVIKGELQHITREWSSQHKYGLKARGTYSKPPLSPVWQAPLPASTVPSTPFTTNGGGQIMLLQPRRKGAGSSSTSSSASRSVPKSRKRYNSMAIASMVFGILSILATLLSCVASGNLFYQDTNTILIFLAIILMPALLAIICGHIGTYRAKTVHGLSKSYDIAFEGLIMGYLFLALSAAFVMGRLLLIFFI